MIIRSKINDKSRLTLDCAKATLYKGSKIEIADIHWRTKEIQNAIKMELIELVGDPPVLPEEATLKEEATVRLRNIHNSKITLDCIKDYGNPGEIILVPVSKMNELEIRNAIAWNMLVNEDAPPQAPQDPKTRTPLRLEELTTRDILKTDASPKTGEIPTVRPRPKVDGALKAKRIGSVSESEEGGSEPLDDGLFRPSEVLMPKAAQKKRPAPPAEELDIFGE